MNDTIKLTMTVQQANELASGIMGLDQDVKDPSKHYKFSVSFRVRHARNLGKLREVLQAFEVNRNQVVMDLNDLPQGEKEKAAQKAIWALQSEKFVFELETFKEEELQLERNPIPVTFLAALQPLLATTLH